MLDQPKKLIFIGFILVLIGAVGPWLMVLGYVESSFLFNFFVYGSSVSGLILGVLGAALLSTMNKRK